MNQTGFDWSKFEQLRNGDNKAFSQFYEGFYASLFYFAVKIIEDPGEANIIVTDIIIKCVKRIQSGSPFDSKPQLKSFLFILVRNKCLDYIRTKKTDRKWNISLEDVTDITEPVSENEIVKAETIAEIYKEVQKLTAGEQKVFILSFIKGYSNPKIVEILGYSDKTVRNLKAKAIKKLKTGLQNKPLLYLVLIGFCPN